MEGLGNTYGFEMARKESNENVNWLVRFMYYTFYYDKPFQNQLAIGVISMAFLEAHE